MPGNLLSYDSGRRMKNLYGKIRDYSSSCDDMAKKCLNHCCENLVQMSYIEFAYLIDFLNSKYDDEYVRKILTKKPIATSTIGFDPKEGPDFKRNYYCRILTDDGCLAYDARPFRCRVYKRDNNMGLCRPLEDDEIMQDKDTKKAWRDMMKLNRSMEIPGELKNRKDPLNPILSKLSREESLDFWIKEFLKI